MEVLERSSNVYQCDGSLIHPSVALTVAHCVPAKNEPGFKVRVGDWDLQIKNEIFPHQDRQVSDIIIHEQYDKVTKLNDIALLFLEKPVDIAEHVNLICLPPQSENVDLKRNCVASGYGKDLFTIGETFPTIMQHVELSVVPRGKCLTELRKTKLGPDFEHNNNFICAGGDKKSCESVGGAPLVCRITNTNNKYYQVGIISWAEGCGDSTIGVYTNVPLLNWIEEKLQLKNLSTTSVV